MIEFKKCVIILCLVFYSASRSESQASSIGKSVKPRLALRNLHVSQSYASRRMPSYAIVCHRMPAVVLFMKLN